MKARPESTVSSFRRFRFARNSLALAVGACFVGLTQANPVGPEVVNGTATFNQVGNVLTVTNSNGAIIHWQQFNIAAGETTHFQQASASSSVLNRVLGGDPSAIYGTLSSNGQVWLINPAGILVGAGGRIDTAGFVASTLNVTNADFLAKRLNFDNGGAGQVVNRGHITTPWAAACICWASTSATKASSPPRKGRPSLPPATPSSSSTAPRRA